jgi:hypothetical protein
MARSKITQNLKDLTSDSGSVLFSLVQGEQLEFPIDLEFLQMYASAYELEAVVVEGLNEGEGLQPSLAKPLGVKTTLAMRIPINKGLWDPSEAYNVEDIVEYGGSWYKLQKGLQYVSSVQPPQDPLWELHIYNRVYLQFPATLASTYDPQPTVAKPVYGFFELRVTEPVNSIYTQTWKPVRGLVEILFSPTHG